jgi:hypothetical protein
MLFWTFAIAAASAAMQAVAASVIDVADAYDFVSRISLSHSVCLMKF